MDVFSKNLKIQIFFPENGFFPRLGLRKNTATRHQTLVHRTGQTIGPTTIKFGTHLPQGTLYGRFFENL